MRKFIVLLAIFAILSSVGFVYWYKQNTIKAVAELNTERYDRMVAEESLDKALTRIATLETSLDKAEKKLSSAEKRLEQATATSTDLKTRLDNISKLNNDLQGKIKELEKLTANNGLSLTGNL